MTDPENKLEIKVSSSTDPNALGGSIVAAYREGKQVFLCAIGPIPVATSYKGVVVANRILAPMGTLLAIIPGLVTREIMDRHTQKLTPWIVSLMRLRNILDRGDNSNAV